MMKRRWVYLLLAIVAIGLISAGIWYYRKPCHGMDACAAFEAESHERDKPSEAQ
jgi:hypothetical protein